MPAHNLRFLVIEPELLTQEDIHDAIEKIGYGTTLGVSTVREGLMALAAGGIDFVICEWVEDTGPEIGFVKLLRAQETQQRLPILLTSRQGPTAGERIKRAAAAGADALLLKPFDAARLQDQIDDILMRSANLAP